MLRRRLRDASLGKRRDEPDPPPKSDALKGVPKGGGGAAYRAQVERQRLRRIEAPRPRGDAWGVYESAHPRGDGASKRVADVLASARASPKNPEAPRAILKREGYTSSVFLPPTAHPGADVERTASPGRRYRVMPVLLSRVTSPSQGPPPEDTSILCDVSAGESSPERAEEDASRDDDGGRFPNTPIVATPSGSGRFNAVTDDDRPATGDASGTSPAFAGFRSTYVRPSPSPGGVARARARTPGSATSHQSESHTEFYERVTGQPFPKSPDPEAPSPTPVSTRTAGTVLGGNGSGRDGGNGSSGPTPSAFLFDGSPEAVDLGTPERSGAVRSVPSEPAEDPTETPAPAPMRISAAMPRVHPEPTPEPTPEPNKPGSSPAKRQTPEFLPRRRHPRFEPSKLPPPIGGTLSLVDRIRSDGDEVMAAEFMETVAPAFSPATSTRSGPDRSNVSGNRSGGRRVAFDVASSPPSRMRNLSDACRKPVGHRDPTRFTPSPARYGTAATRAAKARALSERAAARRKSALAATVLVDARRLRRLEAKSPRARYVAATRGDGLDASVDPEDDAGGAGTCTDASFDDDAQGLGTTTNLGQSDRRVREIAAVIRALDESASPNAVTDAARMMAQAAAKAAHAEAERRALMEDKHARKAISRMTRHRLRAWRQTAATARLARACASKWRVKARRGADLDRKKVAVATKALFGWTHRKWQAGFTHWRDLCAQKAGARVMADLAYSGKRRGTAAAALREWSAVAIESSANRWRETRLKRRVVKEWSDLAAAQRHDGYRAVKTAMLGWRVAIRARERLEELVRSRKAERADDVACRILNCWASLTRRREFSETVLAAMTRLVKRDAWIRRIADDQRRKRLIERWYNVVRDENLRALGHWARRLASRLLAEWAALALAGRRNRERAFTARALRGVVRHQRAVDVARANGLGGVPLTPSPLARARRRRHRNEGGENEGTKHDGASEKAAAEDVAAENVTAKEDVAAEDVTAEKDVATSPDDDAESHARWERRGAREAPPGSSRLARHSQALSDITDSIAAFGADANTPRKIARSVGALAMKAGGRRRVLVPTREVGSGRRRVSAPASGAGAVTHRAVTHRAVTHRARVRWDVDDGSARIDDGDDGDSADYELSSSESEADETRPEPPAADLSPDAAPKPSPGAINPLGTPEPMPEFEELPKEVREALNSPQDPEERTTPIAPTALRDDATELVGFYSPEEKDGLGSPMDRLVTLARNTPPRDGEGRSSSPEFEFRGEVERIDKVLRDLYSNRR